MEGLLLTRQTLSTRALRPWLMVVALLVFGAPASACLDTFTSQIIEAKDTGDQQVIREAVSAAEEAHRKSPTLANTNDLAVAWILTGRAPDGIQLLRDLDKQTPGNAIVAANLGTALELGGADEEALRWIRESVRRDPQEHQRSEWVHAKILEAKLALKQDPNWLRKGSVIGWREGQRLPLDERRRPRAPADIIRAIEYQLIDRRRFVSAPDAIVGDMYLNIGDIAYSVPGAVSDAWQRDGVISQNYRSALSFGTVHEARARSRMEEADKRIEQTRPAMQAAARREEESKANAAERERDSEIRQSDLQDAKRRRQWLAAAAFGTFGLVVAGIFVFRARKAAARGPEKPGL